MFCGISASNGRRDISQDAFKMRPLDFFTHVRKTLFHSLDSTAVRMYNVWYRTSCLGCNKACYALYRHYAVSPKDQERQNEHIDLRMCCYFSADRIIPITIMILWKGVSARGQIFELCGRAASLFGTHEQSPIVGVTKREVNI